MLARSTPPDHSISLQRVCYAYSAGTPEILTNVTLDVNEGEFVCVLGPSGCGKTTVLRLIAGFDTPVSGAIAVNGSAVAGAGPDRGVVFQGDDSVFNWLTAADNVSFGPRMRGASRAEAAATAEKYLDLVGLRAHAAKYPSQLSGGMRQRIQIARVLANDPGILLMDEPFGALDAQTRTELQDELVRIWSRNRKSVIFITHDILEAIILADKIVVMTSGQGAAIREVIDVDLPRPRARSSSAVGLLYDRINDAITHEVNKSRNPAAK